MCRCPERASTRSGALLVEAVLADLLKRDPAPDLDAPVSGRLGLDQGALTLADGDRPPQASAQAQGVRSRGLVLLDAEARCEDPSTHGATVFVLPRPRADEVVLVRWSGERVDRAR